MQAYYYGGSPVGLSVQPKDWQRGTIVAHHLLVHGGPVTPSVARTSGLSPAFATEFLVDLDGNPISGGKMLFSFLICAGNDLPANAEKPAAVGRLWGFNGHCYVFSPPLGTIYWSRGGVIEHGGEVAFEYVVESADIVSYWAPSNNYVKRLGEANSGPRQLFQKTAWHSYLAAYAHNLASIENSGLH